MMNITVPQLTSFALVYLLLLIIIAIFKKTKIDQSRLLFVASLKMTIQLIIAGYILTFIFEDPNPLFTLTYLLVIFGFTVFRVLKPNQELNQRFKIYTATSIVASGAFVLFFLLEVVVNKNIFNPQYIIPFSGMIMGNTMTGTGLALKTFRNELEGRRTQIDVLLNIGAHPKKILFPFVSRAIETALLPTMNNMIGMGIVSLPGMMTGQILAGADPMTAILYQIPIMIAISATVCLSTFGSLYFGYKTMWNKRYQINY